MSDFTDLLDDHEAEHQDLLRIVKPLAGDAPEWDTPTPAEGWAVRDQISHLAYFDAAAHLAVTEPQKFALMAEAFQAQTGDPMEGHLIRGRSMTGDELMDWWETAHGGMAEAVAGVGGHHPVPAGGAPERRFVRPPAAAPDGDPRPLHRPWQHPHIGGGQVLAVDRHRFPAPQRIEQAQRLIQPRRPLPGIAGLA